jgi:hypothetical protein
MGLALRDRNLQTLALESEDADPQLDDGLTYEDLADLVAELSLQPTRKLD